MQLIYLDNFRDEVTWLDEPRPNFAAQQADKKVQRERLERQTQEIRERADAVQREREEAERAPPPAAQRSASEQRRQDLALEQERLAQEDAENKAAIAALMRQEEEDALGRAAVEEEERLQLQAEEEEERRRQQLEDEETLQLIQQLEEEEERQRQQLEDERRLIQAELEEEEERLRQQLVESLRKQLEEEENLRLIQAWRKEAFTCESCQEVMPVGDKFRLRACTCDADKHYCIECMRGWIQSEIGSQALNPCLAWLPCGERNGARGGGSMRVNDWRLQVSASPCAQGMTWGHLAGAVAHQMPWQVRQGRGGSE